MSDCPCSPDVGDCNRCGMKYPPETMNPLLRHEEYSPPLPPSLEKDILRISKEESEAHSRGDAKTFRAKKKEAEDLVDTELKKKGVAGLYSRKKVRQPLLMQGGKTRRNKTSGGDIVTHLLTIRNQVKLYHWQTGSFARHTATDNLTTALDTNIDAFVESYMGRYGRPKVSGSIKLHNFSESAARAFVAKETKYLSSELPRKIGKQDTDLLNLRDTILGDLTKVLYLFTLS
jgi:hypothetical protein